VPFLSARQLVWFAGKLGGRPHRLVRHIWAAPWLNPFIPRTDPPPPWTTADDTLPIDWVTADFTYGQGLHRRRFLEDAEISYVVASASVGWARAKTNGSSLIFNLRGGAWGS
jgi:hypothetical protein